MDPCGNQWSGGVNSLAKPGNAALEFLSEKMGWFYLCATIRVDNAAPFRGF